MKPEIITECYVDTLLMAIVTDTGKESINHQYGCHNVAKVMQNRYYANRPTIGVIDNDKKKPLYFAQFKNIDTHKDILVLWEHHQHRIISVGAKNKSIESFILSAAQEGEINMADYGLPNTLEGLQDITKTNKSMNNELLKKLFRTLKDKSESFRKLGQWLQYGE
ncbi:hypothetical protein AGMMS4956_21450 [Bacteroidia bacterium]|nr:hypothetical protein AGMMS4956_21450 [Bacteroidia bacterium]